MGPILLATVTVPSVDIAAAYGDINCEWTNNTGLAQLVYLGFKFSGLNTGGASAITPKFRLLTSGTNQGIFKVGAGAYAPSSFDKDANGDSVSLGMTKVIFVPSGDTIEARFDSGNASDTTATVEMKVYMADGLSLHTGLLQSATGATATLASTASAVDDFYNGDQLVVVDGAGKQQVFRITDYVGASKVATLDKTPVTTLDNTSVCAVLPQYIDPAVARTTVVDRTIDVSSGGEVGLDWANIGSPTTVQGLTGTTVDLVTDAVDTTALATSAASEIADRVSAISTVPPTTIR